MEKQGFSNEFMRARLFSPGPTPTPLRSQLSALVASPYHRSQEFSEAFQQCRTGLHTFFGAKEAPLLLNCSGTGGMEACVQNLTAAGDEVLVIRAGRFGDRWARMAQAYACKVNILDVPWGKAVTIEAILSALEKSPKTKAVFLQSTETSTGVYQAVEHLAPKIKHLHPDLLIIVDAISSFIAHELKMEEWQIDCVVAASQKALNVAPGLAFVALSELARRNISTRPKFYFDFKHERQEQQQGFAAWTPSSPLIYALQENLKLLCALGPQQLSKHHQILATAMQKGVHALGLALFPKDSPTHALSVVSLPEHCDGNLLLAHFEKKYRASFAQGQEQLKGKVIRIAHMGMTDPMDLLASMAILEFGLKDFGWDFTLGTGISAMMSSLASDA